jgi:hypothetical protein
MTYRIGQIVRSLTDSFTSILSPGLMFVLLGHLYPVKCFDFSFEIFIFSPMGCLKKL